MDGVTVTIRITRRIGEPMYGLLLLSSLGGAPGQW